MFLLANRLSHPPARFLINSLAQFRAPEEYAYQDQSEKVDIYSMGNIFYILIAKLWPFEELDNDKKARTKIKNGERPSIPKEIAESTDPFDIALVKALQMCWIQDQKKRATAREVEKFLDKELLRLGVDKS